MTRTANSTRHRMIAFGAVAALTLVACGGDDDASDGAADAPVEADNETGEPAAEPAPAPESGGSGGGGGGTLVLGDETITIESTQCFLQEQDAAAGGGKILFVAQGRGTNAAGEPLIVDISRYDEDSQFAGDDIIVDIGDPRSDEFLSLSGGGEIGTATVDGNTVSADGLTFQNFDTFEDIAGSVTLNC